MHVCIIASDVAIQSSDPMTATAGISPALREDDMCQAMNMANMRCIVPPLKGQKRTRRVCVKDEKNKRYYG